jgi:hypothetical protein
LFFFERLKLRVAGHAALSLFKAEAPPPFKSRRQEIFARQK